MTELCVVLAGNIGDGYDCYGPFDSFDAASDCADNLDEMCWIMPLSAPRNLLNKEEDE